MALRPNDFNKKGELRDREHEDTPCISFPFFEKSPRWIDSMTPPTLPIWFYFKMDAMGYVAEKKGKRSLCNHPWCMHKIFIRWL